jgi:UrcA family protein
MQPLVHLMCASSIATDGDQHNSGAIAMSSLIASSARIARTVVAALLATTAAGVPASYAQSLMTAPAITVNYSDLNLATTEGSHVLYQRLVDAAQRVCPTGGLAAELRHNRDRRSCISGAVERASKEIKSPRFAEVAAARLR